MTRPRLSVITPVFNGERCIEQCIRSVLSQDCDAAEHIIVDGGSSDRTVPIIESFAARHSHIRWKSEKDRGQSDAMNQGLKMARGEIVGFLNVDDYYEPDVLNRVLKMFEHLPQPSLVVANCRVVDQHGREVEINRPSELALRKLLLWEKYPFPANPSAYFYHSNLQDRIGGYDVEDHFAMDYDFLLRAVQAAHLVYVAEIWGNYLTAPGSKTHDDWARGNGPQRVIRVRRAYVRNLGPWDRLLYHTDFALYHLGSRADVQLRRWRGLLSRARAKLGRWGRRLRSVSSR